MEISFWGQEVICDDGTQEYIEKRVAVQQSFLAANQQATKRNFILFL